MRQRAAIEFSLCWNSRQATHNDRYYMEKVDFWRDILPGSMGDVLPETDPGDSHTEIFTPGCLVPAYVDKKLVTCSRSAITPGQGRNGLVLEPGRYYPKGYFWKPLGSFPVDQTPVRLTHIDDSSLVIDTNHPLSCYPLEVRALVHQRSSIAAQRGGALNDIAEHITAGGPGMQASHDEVRYSLSARAPLRREDETDDSLYYRTPRLVHHLDAAARCHVRSLYGRLCTPRTRILDLMSSWESHIPDSLHSCHVEGLGLNEQELLANKRLAGYLVHDLNKDPRIPLADSSFDAIVCTVSIEYLCRPLEVLSEIARLLVPGGILAITISERWFPGKQIRKWADLHPFERQGVVMNYLLDQGSFGNIQTESIRGYPRPAEDKYSDRMSKSDSLYFIWAACLK
jgi:SAM-dependent methyltransferase